MMMHSIVELLCPSMTSQKLLLPLQCTQFLRLLEIRRTKKTLLNNKGIYVGQAFIPKCHPDLFIKISKLSSII